jgi:hypothetical protein
VQPGAYMMIMMMMMMIYDDDCSSVVGFFIFYIFASHNFDENIVNGRVYHRTRQTFSPYFSIDMKNKLTR